MKNRLFRIRQLVQQMELNGWCMSRAEICSSLGISSVTLGRYLDYLEGCGFRFEVAKDHIRVLEKGMLDKSGTVFSKASYSSFKVLMYIYNNNPCSRERLRRFFTKQEGGLPEEGKMSLRNLDIHLRQLIGLGYIEKYMKDREIFYKIAIQIIPEDYLTFEKLLGLFNYLSIYRSSLPFQDKIEDILDKLSGALTNYVRRSAEAFENVKVAYEIFPDCLHTETGEDLDILARSLEEYCHTNTMLEVSMKSGAAFRIIPLLVEYNSNSGKWYLICKYKNRNDSFNMLRLDQIMSVRSLGKNPGASGQKREAELAAVRQEVEASFSICLEEPLYVKVVFKEAGDMKAIIKRHLENDRGRLTELKNGSLWFEGYIQGAMDFYAWIKRFGSNAVILQPEYMKEMHMNSAHKTIGAYSRYRGGDR